MNVPVIGLFGYTNPRRSGPYRRFTDLVVDGYVRHPGEEPGIALEKRAGGMDRVTPEKVLEKVRLAMDRYVGRPL
jgi:heptosyltransferase I